MSVTDACDEWRAYYDAKSGAFVARLDVASCDPPRCVVGPTDFELPSGCPSSAQLLCGQH
jgi:hypothetical protein